MTHSTPTPATPAPRRNARPKDSVCSASPSGRERRVYLANRKAAQKELADRVDYFADFLHCISVRLNWAMRTDADAMELARSRHSLAAW